MVCSQEEHIAALHTLVIDPSNRLVCLVAPHNRSLVHPSMPHHIGRCEVVHQELELLLSDALAQLLRDSGRAHFGLLVVCGHFRTRDQFAFFALKLLLDAAIEEEGDVGVLFRLGDVALLEALLAKPLGQRVAHVLWRERNWEWVIRLVLRHGGDVDILGVWEVRARGAVVVAEQLRALAHAVGAIVEEEKSVIILDACLVAVENHGLEELVGLACLVAGLDCGRGIGGRVLAFAADEAAQAGLDALPALIPIHYVVAANDCAKLASGERRHGGEEGAHMPHAGPGIGVAAIAEEVDVDVGNGHVAGGFQ